MGSLSKRGHKIFVFVISPNHKKPRVSYLKENEIDVVQIHSPLIGLGGRKGILRHLNYLVCIPTILKEAGKIISKHKIDYVYSYMPGTGSSIPAMKICSKYDIPFVLDLADMYSMIRPKMVIEKSFRNADKILVITNYLKNDLLKKGIASDKIQIIPNGVDLELFNPDVISLEEIKKIRRTFQSEKIIVFSGSLQDLNIIIESAPHVIEKIPNVKFVIIGDHRDPSRSKLFWENKTREKKLHEHFIFLGRLPRKEIPRYILSADVCVDSFPNEPYYAAAHPIKLLEYGACGKPVVATNVEETSKLVIHGKFGFLTDPSDSVTYAKYIIQLLDDSHLAKTMGNAFLEHIKANFNWNYLSEKIEETLT